MLSLSKQDLDKKIRTKKKEKNGRIYRTKNFLLGQAPIYGRDRDVGLQTWGTGQQGGTGSGKMRMLIGVIV